jgi:hypothetical protein
MKKETRKSHSDLSDDKTNELMSVFGQLLQKPESHWEGESGAARMDEVLAATRQRINKNNKTITKLYSKDHHFSVLDLLAQWFAKYPLRIALASATALLTAIVAYLWYPQMNTQHTSIRFAQDTSFRGIGDATNRVLQTFHLEFNLKNHTVRILDAFGTVFEGSATPITKSSQTEARDLFLFKTHLTKGSIGATAFEGTLGFVRQDNKKPLTSAQDLQESNLSSAFVEGEILFGPNLPPIPVNAYFLSKSVDSWHRHSVPSD